MPDDVDDPSATATFVGVATAVPVLGDVPTATARTVTVATAAPELVLSPAAVATCSTVAVTVPELVLVPTATAVTTSAPTESCVTLASVVWVTRVSPAWVTRGLRVAAGVTVAVAVPDDVDDPSATATFSGVAAAVPSDVDEPAAVTAAANQGLQNFGGWTAPPLLM